MKKLKKLSAILTCIILSSCNGTKNIYIPDENIYHWANTPALKPELDDGVKIDGEFNDLIYKNIRWLNAVDRPDNEKSSIIRVGTAITTKGIYIAVDVEETGSKIYVNPSRASCYNSCIELYMDIAGEANMTQRAFEFDMVPNGEYSIRSRVPSRSDWRSAYAPSEISPITAAKTKGGKLNSDSCYGYSCEAFFPKEYLEKYGYEFSENMEVALNPVHIISLDYNLTNQLARIYSQWMQDYSTNYNWNNPNSWLIFGKDGLQAYDIEIEITGDKSLGAITSTSGDNVIFKGHDGELKIFCLNESKLTKLMINDKNSLSKVRWSGDIGYLTIAEPNKDVKVEAEFSK